jgi:hypothetical protein
MTISYNSTHYFPEGCIKCTLFKKLSFSSVVNFHILIGGLGRQREESSNQGKAMI